MKTAGIVCGWVILFRILIAYLQKWAFAGLPPAWSCLLSGLLELTNGCCGLAVIPETGIRFMIAAVLLTCGGKDEVCPPETISALYDALSGTKSLTYLADTTHGYTQEFVYLAKAWLRMYA